MKLRNTLAQDVFLLTNTMCNLSKKPQHHVKVLHMLEIATPTYYYS